MSPTETTGPLPGGTAAPSPSGRRRRPGPAVETPAAALEKPVGRRRKTSEPHHAGPAAPRPGEAPLAELPELQGVQPRPELRRQSATASAAVQVCVQVSEVTFKAAGTVETSASIEAADVLGGRAEPVEHAGRASHRKASPSRRAAAVSKASVTPIRRPETGHRRKPKKAILPGLPGSPAVVAGAAAVAVGVVGVVAIADEGPAVGAADAAQASAVEVAPATVAQVQREILTADEQAREKAVRASRQRARAALAERKQEAAQLEKKEELARKALEVAHARVVRLAQLAKLFALPVKGYRLTADFGDGGLWSHRHTGLDFACSWGTPIRAIASGEVVSAKWDGAYGWKTVIRLPDGTETWYAHQSAFVVRSGHVEAGQIIGRVGSTGHATGPHLHLEVRVKDVPVNPRQWLQARGLRP